MDLVFVLIIAFTAAMIATITGFGSATILTPFVAMAIDIKAAIVLVAFFHFANNLTKFALMRKSINLRLVLVYGLPSVISALVGAWIFGSVDVSLITLFFSIFLVTFSLYSIFKPKIRIPEKDIILGIGGLISGLTSGLIGVGGAIRSMFLISTFLRKPNGDEYYCHHEKGIKPITTYGRAPEPIAMPEAIMKDPKVSFWYFCFELHSGHVFKPLLGKNDWLLAFIGGLCLTSIGITGIDGWFYRRS